MADGGRQRGLSSVSCQPPPRRPPVKLSGTGALVSGGASGLGAATARALASSGASVAITGTDQGHIDTAVSALGKNVVGIRADVRQYADVEGALAQLECVTVSAHVEGDHTIFVGRVERAGSLHGEPLLYFRGRYERLAAPPSDARP